MTQQEKNEIRQLPKKYRPMGAWGYFGCSILFTLPGIGLIIALIFAIAGQNIARRSFARSFFCIIIIGIVFVGVFLIFGGLGIILDFLQSFPEDFAQFMQGA